LHGRKPLAPLDGSSGGSSTSTNGTTVAEAPGPPCALCPLRIGHEAAV
jgi:hypothetical protein